MSHSYVRPLLLTLACAAAGMAPGAMAAEAAAPDCSIASLGGDRDFAASVSRYFPTESYKALSCKVASQQMLGVDGLRLRFSIADILNDGRYNLDADVVIVERMEASGPHPIGRVVLPPDPLDMETRFAPQLVKKDGAILVRLSPRHDRIYRLDGDRLVAIPAFDWRDDLRLYPNGGKGGQALGIDLERMEGRIALTNDRSYSGAAPPSTFDTPKIGVARLAFRDNRLTILDTETVDRRKGEYPFIDKLMAEEEAARAVAKDRPRDVEACAIEAWSTDKDVKGLNVRAEPNVRSKILGVVPPPRKMPKEQEAFDKPVASEFDVIGYRDGWFLIENIKAPGVGYDVPYPKNLPQPFRGRGWVSANMVGAAASNGGLPMGRLYRAPHAEAAFDEVRDKSGWPFGADTPIARVFACSGAWGLIETKEGKRGWTRSLCSNQATNCS